MSKVIFLDIDGPMLSHSALQFVENQKYWYENKNYVRALPDESIVRILGNGVLARRRRFDPIAVNLLNRLLLGHDAQLVISSSWRALGRDNLAFILQENGIDEQRLHKVWSVRNPRLTATRAQQITDWLVEAEARGEAIEAFAAVDDDKSILSLAGGVLVPFSDGLRWPEFCSASAALGGGISMKEIAIAQDGSMWAQIVDGSLGEAIVAGGGRKLRRYNFGCPQNKLPSPKGCMRFRDQYSIVRMQA